MGLGFLITAKDFASGVMHKVENAFRHFSHAAHEMTEHVSKSFMAFGGAREVLEKGMQVFEAFEPAVEAAHAFAKSIELVSTRVDESIFPQEKMIEITNDLSASFGKLPTEETKALYEAVAEGANDATKAQGLLTAANQLSVATQTDLHESLNVTSQLVKAFGIDFKDSAAAADALFVASKHVEGGLGGVEGILDKIAPVAKRAGLDMNDLLGYVVQLSNAGIKGRAATSGLKAVIDAMIKHGPNVLAQSIGMTNAQLEQLFGSSEGATAAMALMQNRGGDLSKVLEEITHSAGAAGEAATKMIDPKEQYHALLAQALIKIGEVLEKTEKAAYRFGVQILTAFNKIPKPVIEILVKVAAGVAALGGSILLAAGAVAYGSAAITALGGVFAALSEIIVPILVVVGALALAVYALRTAWEMNLGGIRDFAVKVWERVKLTFEAMTQVFESGGFSGAVREELSKAENQGIKAFVINVYAWVKRIENFFEGIANGFRAALRLVQPAIQAFEKALDRVSDAFVSTREDAASAASIFDAFGSTGEGVGSLLAQVFGMVVNVMTAVLDIIAGVGEGWEAMKGPVGGISAAFGFLWDQLKSLLVTLGIMDASTAATGDGWVILGKVIGGVAQVIVQVIAGIAAALGAVVWVIEKAIGLMKYLHGPTPQDIMARSGELQGTATTGGGLASNKSTFGAPTNAAEGAPPASPLVAGATGPYSPTANMPALGAAGASVEHAQPADLSEMKAHLDTISKNTAEAKTLNAVLVMDGEAVGRVTAKTQKNASIRSFEPNPVPT